MKLPDNKTQMLLTLNSAKVMIDQTETFMRSLPAGSASKLKIAQQLEKCKQQLLETKLDTSKYINTSSQDRSKKPD